MYMYFIFLLLTLLHYYSLANHLQTLDFFLILRNYQAYYKYLHLSDDKINATKMPVRQVKAQISLGNNTVW